MYITKVFYTIKDCVEYANEQGYQIINIVPTRFEKTTFDEYQAGRYEVVYK